MKAEEEDSNQINNLDDDNDETKTNVDEKINDNNKNSEEQKEMEMTAFSSSNATHSSDGDDNALSSTTLSSSKPERTVSYPLENFMAMGFDMEMIQVSECLLFGAFLYALYVFIVRTVWW